MDEKPEPRYFVGSLGRNEWRRYWVFDRENEFAVVSESTPSKFKAQRWCEALMAKERGE